MDVLTFAVAAAVISCFNTFLLLLIYEEVRRWM